MALLELPPAAKRELRGIAHHIDPVVMIGQHGITGPLLHEIDNALISHELVKVRVHGDDRQERNQMLLKICDALSCAPVQHLGKLFILFRPGKVGAIKGAAAAAKPAKERPKHTDFPAAPARGTTPQTKKPRADASEAKARAPGKSAKRGEWWDASLPVAPRAPKAKRGVTPNPRTRAPRAGQDSLFGNKRPPPRAANESPFEPRGRTAPADSGMIVPPPTESRRRLRADAAEQKFAAAGGDENKRYRWKDRDSWPTNERTPRPTTRTTPKANVRGAARNTPPGGTQSRRRLKDGA